MHVGGRSTDKSIHDVRLAERPAEAREDLRLSTDGEPFAVDQYPVAIEDDEVKAAHEEDVISTDRLGSTD